MIGTKILHLNFSFQANLLKQEGKKVIENQTGIAGLVEKEIKWRDVEVGDLVVVKEGEDIPADLVLIATSYNDGKSFI